MFATLVVCAWAICSLSVGMLKMSVMCSIPKCDALSCIGVYPRPISVAGLCTASVGKLGVGPNAFLASLLRILCFVPSCLFVNIPRWVAWYLDLSNWSITSFFRW